MENKLPVTMFVKIARIAVGVQVCSIAYPGCVADGETFSAVSAAGYSLGFSCGRSIDHYGNSRLSLSRIHVDNELECFKRMLVQGR
ncbi:MAG: hypothetical protein PHG63_01560 [Candidatus Dojkabacteria bacterium]|nr:hypothetical protein [Candidatus Dojkabacteria bacterium]